MSDALEPALAADEIAALEVPSAYPGDASASRGVEHVQTHLSHVFLTRDRVYKFRKAVDLGFVRFTTREERNADCLREVALNRRLAPDVYLGVAPLEAGPSGVRVGAPEEVLHTGPSGSGPEHCVVMRRLPEGRNARDLLERGALGAEQIGRIAVTVAGFHDAHGLGVPAPWDATGWLERIRAPVLANFEHLNGPGIDAPTAERVRELVEREAEFFRQARPAFERRRVDGRAVDGHGDLHLEHIWFEREEGDPCMIDCVEFDADLRRIDAASEMAFPAMDLRYRGHRELAERLLRIYARERDDFDLYAVVEYFVSYRAGVRAKVASIAARQPEVPTVQRKAAGESARRHVALAADALAPPPSGSLWLVGGIIGTGKSTAAEVLAEATDGVVIASDRVRKRLAGLGPTERPDARQERELYSDAHSRRTYAGLLERAEPVLASGRATILDATFSSRQERARAHTWARERGVEPVFVEVVCTESVTRERLARRRAEGRDPSDAGPDLYAMKAAQFEPVGEWPAARHLVVRTDESGWRARLREAASAVSG